jgi:hypothetical protein
MARQTSMVVLLSVFVGLVAASTGQAEPPNPDGVAAAKLTDPSTLCLLGGGIVTRVKGRFAGISLGSDDGLRLGDMLHIIGDRKYFGRVVVRRLDPDRAVVEIFNQRNLIRPGSRVSTVNISDANGNN